MAEKLSCRKTNMRDKIIEILKNVFQKEWFSYMIRDFVYDKAADEILALLVCQGCSDGAYAALYPAKFDTCIACGKLEKLPFHWQERQSIEVCAVRGEPNCGYFVPSVDMPERFDTDDSVEKSKYKVTHRPGGYTVEAIPDYKTVRDCSCLFCREIEWKKSRIQSLGDEVV